MKTTLMIFIAAFIVSAANAQTANKWQAMERDTANYYRKDVSIGSDYITQLMPIRDTIPCYFEIMDGLYLEDGRVHTQWYKGYATRTREHITGFLYASKRSTKYATVLYYKIVSK